MSINYNNLNNELLMLKQGHNLQRPIKQQKQTQQEPNNFNKPGNNVYNTQYKNPYIQDINKNKNLRNQTNSLEGNGDIVNRHNNSSQQNQNIVNNQLNQHQQFNPKLFVQNEQYNNNSLVDQQIQFQKQQISNQQNLNPHYNNLQNQKFNANQQHYQGQQQFSQQSQFTRNPQQRIHSQQQNQLQQHNLQQRQNQNQIEHQTNQSSSDGYVDPRENMNDRMGMLRFDNVAHNRSNLVPVNMNHIYSGNLFSEGNPIPEDLKHLYHNENINSSNRILHQEKSKTMYKDDINQRMANMTQMSNSRFGFVTDSQQQQINQQNMQVGPSNYNTNNPNQYQPNGLDMYYGSQSNPQTPQQAQHDNNIHKSLQPSSSDMKLANRNAMNSRLNQFELMNNTKPMIQYPGQGINPVSSFMPEMTK